ncbi:TPA: YgiT-type zinc finger protein [Candidatus Micrarchaeota archaeon]|nr:YgiT-type zinc finger protein [Candidatus Micrarchaeota archaeon]
MKCPTCGQGVLKKQKVTVEKFGTTVGVFTAEVCSACGEQIFDSRESARIETKIKQLGALDLPA